MHLSNKDGLRLPMKSPYNLSPLISVSGLFLFLPLLHLCDVIGAFLSLKGGEKNIFEKIKIWFVQIEKNFPVG